MKRDLLVWVACCLLLSACGTESAPRKYKLPKNYNKPAQITLTEAQLRQMKFSQAVARWQIVTVETPAAGQVEVDPNRTTPVLSLVPGVIESVSVKIGDLVKTGQVLARVRNDDVAQLESDSLTTILALEGQHRQVEADRKLAQATFERKKLLFDEDIDPKAELEAAATELAKSGATLSDLDGKRTAAITSVTQRLRLYGLPFTEIDRLLSTRIVRNTFDVKSPEDGLITEENINDGQRISTTDKLFQVSDLSKVLLVAQVFEKSIAGMRRGLSITARIDGLPNKVFAGTVEYVGSELDRKSRTLPIRAEIDNRQGILKPKMFARFVVRTGQARILAVPGKAVQKLGESSLVFVAIGPRTFQERHVEPGITVGSVVEICTGLKSGETVAADGSLQLQGLALQQAATKGD